MKKLLLIFVLIGCKKSEIIKPVNSISLKNDYSGTWWCDCIKDSLAIHIFNIQKDSVKYKSNMSCFDNQLTHYINFEPTDDNLILTKNGDRYSFRKEH